MIPDDTSAQAGAPLAAVHAEVASLRARLREAEDLLRFLGASRQAEAELRERNARLDLLARTGGMLVLSRGADVQVLQQVFEAVSRALGFEFFFHYQVAAGGSHLQLMASGGLDGEQRERYGRVAFGQYLCGRVAQRRERLVAEHLPESPYAALSPLCSAGARCYVGVPLLADGHLLGTIAFATGGRDRLREGELELVQTVCDLAAVQMARARSEAALRERETHLSLALEASLAITFDWDIVRDRVRRLHSTGPGTPGSGDERVYTFEAVQHAVHPDDRAHFRAAVALALASRDGVYQAEFRRRRRDGQVRWVSQRGRVEFDAQRRPLRLIGISLDITQRKASEHAMEAVRLQAEQALKEEARRKDEFLAMLAHEMRNPLAPIRSAAAVLKLRGPAEPLLVRCRDIIDRQVGHMARLLDDLLDVSRLSRGMVSLQRAPLALKEVIDAAVETSQPLIEQQSLRLVTAPVDAGLVVDGDVARLTQVFANLLNNAAKYSHPGGHVELAVQAGPDAVTVHVRDEGIGIAADMVGRVFDLFVQTADARRHSPGGLGIGLSLSRRLVEMHGGRIEASSAGEGQGSRFSVTLPLLAAAVAVPPPTPAAPLRRACRVLVVDDNVDAADTTALMLGALGCAVSVVYDGESAVQAAERLRPQAVVLDLGMQGVDGYEACRRIRAAPWGRGMTLVALSGWGQKEDRQRSASAGFDAHLTKPADASALAGALGATRARSAPP